MLNPYPGLALGYHIRRLATSPLKSNQPIQFVLRAKAIYQLVNLRPGRQSGPHYAQQPNPIIHFLYYFVHTKHSPDCAGRYTCGVVCLIIRTVPTFMILFAIFAIFTCVLRPENGHQQARRARSKIILAVTTTQTLTLSSADM